MQNTDTATATTFCDGCDDLTETIKVQFDGDTLNLCTECR